MSNFTGSLQMLAFIISLKIVSKRDKVKLLLCHFFLNHYCCSNDESDD
ncbi:conserved hypothetical protein [Vibrio crassostreae]|nr:conserved hypothetical protein [Vibrio crassostreae]CAK2866731.1 conserved hypothetical protein [Vibrio crassostreae]CAK2878596.1 conserved hypothetical protein [Vibrio crassostreae]